MTILSREEFANRVISIAGELPKFVPQAIYDEDGDCIEFLMKPDAFRAERLDELVTVYWSQDTGDLIGSMIKGVSKFYKELTKQMPGFQIEIHDGPVRLVHLFRARLWSKQSDAKTVRIYQKLIEAASETLVEGELCSS